MNVISNLISQAGGGGNLVTGDGFFREYNSLNQLTLIRNGSAANSPILEQYYYDPFNERIKIWRNDSASTTVYTPFRELMQIRNSSGVYNFTYVYDGSILVARVNPDGSKYYYHPDHLGSTTLITDENGNVVEETFYEPYGLVLSGGDSEVKLYTGQFDDELTNQYYYGARYYIPSIGRFGQADPIIQNSYDPQALNHYAYVRNNPYKFVDPNGKEPVTTLSAAAIGYFVWKVWNAYLSLVPVAQYVNDPDSLSPQQAGGASIDTGVSLIPLVGDLQGAANTVEFVKDPETYLTDPDAPIGVGTPIVRELFGDEREEEDSTDKGIIKDPKKLNEEDIQPPIPNFEIVIIEYSKPGYISRSSGFVPDESPNKPSSRGSSGSGESQSKQDAPFCIGDICVRPISNQNKR